MKVEFSPITPSQHYPLIPSSQINLPHQKDVHFLGGGDDKEAEWVTTVLNGIATALTIICCCPCIILVGLYDYFFSSDEFEEELKKVVKFIENKNPKMLFWDVSKPEAYYSQIELLLKIIILELKKLENDLKNAPVDQQEKIQIHILRSFPRGLGSFLPYQEKLYQELLFSCRKLINKDPADCILSLIIEVKEDAVRNFSGDGFHPQQIMTIRKMYGEDLGFIMPSISKSSEEVFVFKNSDLTLDQIKEFIKNKFSKEKLVNGLLAKLNNEFDLSFYADYLKGKLKEDIDNSNPPIDLDVHFSTFFKKAKFTSKASEYFIEKAFPSPLFDDAGEINWDMMKIVPTPIDFSKMDVSEIQLKELSEIWQRVYYFNSK